MSITSIIESGVVINAVDEGDTLKDVADYIPQHIDAWGDCNVLWDVTRLNFSSVDSYSVYSLVHQCMSLSEERSGLKTAILVNSDLGYGMMRMLQLFAEEKVKFILRVFREKEEAIEWLNE